MARKAIVLLFGLGGVAFPFSRDSSFAYEGPSASWEILAKLLVNSKPDASG